jgi:hypothetical protein
MKPIFIKTYVLFTLLVLLVVIPLELLFSPNHPKTIAEFGWGYFIFHTLFGMVILYAFLSLIGTVILLKKAYDPVIMGILSLILGFAIEFIFMKPDWVHSLLTFEITGGVIFAVFISAVYWVAVWGFPSYVMTRSIKRESPS